jgi:hypothetical protein
MQNQRKIANQQRLKSEMTSAQASTNKALALAQQANRKPIPRAKPRKAKPLPQTPQKMSPHMKDSLKCALQYFSALLDPYATPEGACVPYGFPEPSRRDKCVIRGGFSLGTTGVGFISFAPIIAKDVTCLTFTGSTSAGTPSTVFSSFTNLSTLVPSHLPYTQADLTSGLVSGRFVAGGVRIRYRGTEAARNGVTYAIEDINHINVSALTTNDVVGAPNTRPMRPQPEGQWVSVNWSGPAKASECSFVNTANFIGTTPIVIAIQGVAGDSYEIEAIVHAEYTGMGVDGMERSHNNSAIVQDGLAVIKGSVEAAPLGSYPAKSLFDELCGALDTTARKVIKQIPDIIDVIAPTMLKLGTVMLL